MSRGLGLRRNACAASRLTIAVAHAPSSAALVGRHEKIRVAARRRRHAGHALRPDDAQVLEVRERGHAVRDADLGVGERVIDRRDQVVDRPLEALQERRGDALRAGGDVNGRRLQREAGRHLRHVRIDVEQRPALAVDRHVDLLAGRGPAEEEPVGVAVQLEAEDVVAVRGKHVHDGDAAARAERRAVHARQLRRRLRHAVARLGRLGVGIADGERRHLARGAQVAFHQRRRQRLRVGDVVEALADRIGRQQRVDVDVERQQILDGARVLDAVEPLERAPSGVRPRRGGGVDARLERLGQRDERGLVRAPRAGRRHHAGAQLPDHLLGDVGVSRRARRSRTSRATVRRPCRDRCGSPRSTCRTRAV